MAKNNFYKNKKILVTGGAGSIGSKIIKELLKYSPKVIRALDNNETGLFDLEHELSSERLRLLIGDVRDKRRLIRAMEGVDIVFHAAALKHVPLCEYNPFEAVQTNVIGTQNVIDACLDTEVERMINISTDKAVSPINVMGATKLLTERLVSAACYYKGKRKTVFASVRFGNVLNSRGSILPLFKKQIRDKGLVTVTDPEMTRFIMSFDRAVKLILEAAVKAKGGEVFILKMPVLRTGDLTEAIIEELAPKYGYKPEQIKIKLIGERTGEKLHEELMTEYEAKKAYETKNMFIIFPSIIRKKSTQKHLLKKSYSSKNETPLNKKEVKKLLKEILSLS